MRWGVHTFVNIGTLGLPIMIVPYVAPGLDALRDKVKLYFDAFRAAGHRHEPEVLAFFMVYITDDLASLRERTADLIRAFAVASEQTERKMRGERDPIQYAHFKSRADKTQLYNFDALHGGRKVLFGTPQHCAEVVELWAREVGVTYTTIMPSWGGLPEATVHTNMRRFAGEVIPLVERSAARA